MAFSRYFKVVAILLAVLVGFSAAKKMGKTRYVAGGPLAEHQKEGKEWITAKTGKQVDQKDQFRTGNEAQIIISLSDGSSLTINERTQISMEQIYDKDSLNKTSINIINGKVNFNAQKQAIGNEIKFKTGNAAATIRGTDGVVGKNKFENIVAALREGQLVISNNGKETTLNGGQTAISLSSDSILVLNLKSSGRAKFLDIIDSLLSNPKLTGEKLIKEIIRQDSIFVAKEQKILAGISCTTETIPDTIYTPNLNVSANCSAGISVAVLDTPVPSEGAKIELGVDWEEANFGAKKFFLSCYTDSLTSYPCGMVHTYYARPATTTLKHLTITTSSPAKICSPGSITVEGTYDTTDPNAELYVKLGNYTSKNLTKFSVNGQFSHTINISDKNRNWNANKASVIYRSKTYGSEEATIDLSVDKACKEVNLLPPTITLMGHDSVKCKIDAAIGNVDGDITLFNYYVDGVPSKEKSYTKNSLLQITQKKGVHDYVFEIKDIAGNKSSVKKTLGCYPVLKGVSVRLKGGTTETPRVPPLPGNMTSPLFTTMEFSVEGLPENSPIYIKNIVISQPNKPSVNLRGTDLTSNKFEQQVELVHGVKTPIKIMVYLKSGQTIFTEKIYEVP